MSIILSIPENVIHFNNQICLLKCSKRFISNQDFASQSIEKSQEEEEEDNIEEEEKGRERRRIMSLMKRRQRMRMRIRMKMVKRRNLKRKMMFEEDCLSSDLDDRLFSILRIPSDHIMHYDQHKIIFKYSRRFFNHDLTDITISERMRRLVKDER